MRISGWLRVICLTLSIAALQACVQWTPTPDYARAGNTIVIGVGGVHRNASSAAYIPPSAVTVSLTDSLGSLHQLKVESLFRAYPGYGANSTAAAIHNGGSGLDTEPYDGGWFVVASLVDSNDNPLSSIAVGPASVAVSSAQLTNTLATGAFDIPEGDLNDLGLEILEGTASYDSDYILSLQKFAPLPGLALIRPNGLVGNEQIGAARYRFEFSGGNATAITAGIANGDYKLYAIPAHHNPFVQINSHLVDNGDGSGYLDIYVLNPYGFSATTDANFRGALHQDLSVQVAAMAEACHGCLQQWGASFTLNPVVSEYYDIDGNPLAGVTPMLELPPQP